jgi:hypothetical protein
VSLPFHRVLPPFQAVRLSYQLVHLEGVRPGAIADIIEEYRERKAEADKATKKAHWMRDSG